MNAIDPSGSISHSARPAANAGLPSRAVQSFAQ
jgi:hypothetical protein